MLYTASGGELAAVIGVPDAYHGEVVKACVVLKPRRRADAGRADRLLHVHLAPFKIPRQIDIRDSLPMSAVGKILYRVLRDELGIPASGTL